MNYFPLSIKTKVYFSFVYCRICQIYCFANHLSFMKAYVLWNHLHDTCLALCLSMAATRSLSQIAPLYADRLIAPLSSLRRCTILWALINPMLPCSQACTHPLTPTANQLSLCITAAPHPPSPHASPCTPSSQAKTVTHMPTWPSTPPRTGRQVARDLQTCPSLLWMWVSTLMVVWASFISRVMCYLHFSQSHVSLMLSSWSKALSILKSSDLWNILDSVQVKLNHLTYWTSWKLNAINPKKIIAINL